MLNKNNQSVVAFQGVVPLLASSTGRVTAPVLTASSQSRDVSTSSQSSIAWRQNWQPISVAFRSIRCCRRPWLLQSPADCRTGWTVTSGLPYHHSISHVNNAAGKIGQIKMPFVLRQVQPVALSRGGATEARVSELDPRQLISNVTLAACLRQLASLVVTAHDMFGEYERQAQQIYERSCTLKGRLGRLQTLIDGCDCRSVPVRKWRSPLSIVSAYSFTCPAN